jgi:hypothetical protein
MPVSGIRSGRYGTVETRNSILSRERWGYVGNKTLRTSSSSGEKVFDDLARRDRRSGRQIIGLGNPV